MYLSLLNSIYHDLITAICHVFGAVGCLVDFWLPHYRDLASVIVAVYQPQLREEYSCVSVYVSVCVCGLCTCQLKIC